MGSIKDRDGMDLTDVEDIKKKWLDFNPYFTDEETETQRSSERRTDFPKLHNQRWYSQDLNMPLSFPVPHLLAINSSDIISWWPRIVFKSILL